MNRFIQDAINVLPYGFVSVKGSKSDVLPAQPFDNPQGEVFTGRVECTLRALSPLICGNTQVSSMTNGKNRIHIKPLVVNSDKPVISRHTLKGCMSSFVASYLGIPMTRINDRRHTFRPNMSPDEGRILRGYGIISKIQKTDEVIQSVEVTQLTGDCGFCSFRPGTVKTSTILNKVEEPFSYDEKRFGMLRRLKATGGRYNDDLCFFVYHDGLDGRGTFARTFANDRRPSQHNYFAILASNHPAGRTMPVFTIDAPIIGLYNHTLNALTNEEALSDHPQSNNNAFNAAAIKTNMRNSWRLNAGDIVFFEYEKGTTNIKTFGKHFRYRWAYNRSVGETPDVGWVEDEFTKAQEDGHGERPRLSHVRELFGYSVAENDKGSLPDIAYQILKKANMEKTWFAKAGKVQFNFALYDRGGEHRKYMILPRPGSPKSTAYEFYVNQKPGHDYPLNTYGDPLRDDYSEPHRVGWKWYYKDYNAAENHALKEDDPQKDYLVYAHDVCLPKRANGEITFPAFKFTLHFENMTVVELQLLLYVLTLGSDNFVVGDTVNENDFINAIKEKRVLCHQIGYGKNYGMGAVQIAIENFNLIKYDSTNMTFSEEKGDHNKFIKEYAKTGANRLNEMLPIFALEDKKRDYPVATRLDKYKNKETSTPIYHSKLRGEDLKVRRR